MNRNILVTGVSQGLGLAIARAVAGAGWSVYGVSRRLSEEYRALMGAHEGQVFFHAIELSDAAGAAARLFKEFVPYSLQLHGLVNNAAIAYDDLVTNLDLERLESMFAVNVFSPMMLTRCAIRNMLLHRTAGSLVHVSSISVHTGYKGMAMYAATKGALEAFSRNTAREWGERSIRSNCVVAGFMDTAMNSALTAEQKERVHQRSALKEATRPESVADMVVFLLGDGAASVTGQHVVVDAGTI